MSPKSISSSNPFATLDTGYSAIISAEKEDIILMPESRKRSERILIFQNLFLHIRLYHRACSDRNAFRHKGAFKKTTAISDINGMLLK